jgi:hypothetical protein
MQKFGFASGSYIARGGCRGRKIRVGDLIEVRSPAAPPDQKDQNVIAITEMVSSSLFYYYQREKVCNDGI